MNSFSAPASSVSVLENLARIKGPKLGIEGVEAMVLHAPIASPVRGAFGKMDFQPGLLVKLTDASGQSGFGEIWANFPQGGANYKAVLTENYIAPLLVGQAFRHPAEIIDLLEEKLACLTLQTGDFGAMAQIFAGIDQAAWDLFCKRLDTPFWQLAQARPEVLVYASGIGPEGVANTIRKEAAFGHCRFKIKMGFGEAIDRANLEQALAALPEGGLLMTDANQVWSPELARQWLQRQDAAGVFWCEEPLRADTSPEQWKALAASAGKVRLAAGENLRGLESFVAIARTGGVSVLQPDVGKWGGITRNLQLDGQLRGSSVWICPHWLSGAVGLAASLQFKAAIGGEGFVEVDTNPNKLRTGLLNTAFRVRDGKIILHDDPGLVPPLALAMLDKLKSPTQGVSD